MFKGLEPGCDVIIVSIEKCSSHYTSELLEKTGTIVDYYQVGDKDLRGVVIPGMYNEKSRNGAYWFPIKNLKLKTEENVMKKDIFVVGKDAKVVLLANPVNCDDTSLGVYHGDINIGDIVVCNYGYSNGALSVRQVVALDYTQRDVDCEIMGICNVTDYLERKAKAARRAELKDQMIAQAKKFQEEEYWRLLSESDPAMKALYEEFKKLED